MKIPAFAAAALFACLFFAAGAEPIPLSKIIWVGHTTPTSGSRRTTVRVNSVHNHTIETEFRPQVRSQRDFEERGM